MDPWKVEVFMAYAHAPSAREAGYQYGISGVHVLRIIRQLEGELGYRLLTRYGKRLQLTQFGARLVRRGDEFLAYHADFRQGLLRDFGIEEEALH